MKKLILFLLLFISYIGYATQPIAFRALNTSQAVTTGGSYTWTITGVALTGDSVGVVVEFDNDSISGTVKYRYVSPTGYYDVLYASAHSLATISNTTGVNTAVFSEKIPRVAGSNRVEIYVVITNNNYNTQTIAAKLYTITWR